MKNLIILIIVSFSIVIAKAQQEPQFTFNQHAMHFYNPSAAGNREGPVFTGIHRQQWLGFQGAPRTQLMSFHMPLADQKAGAGMVLSRQRVGISSQFTAALSYSYSIKLTEKTSLRMGIHTLLDQFKLDVTGANVVIESSGDQVITQGDFLKNATVNVGAGLLLNIEEQFLIGLSVPKMLPATLLVDEQSNALMTSRPHLYLSLLGKWKLYGENELRQAFLIKVLPDQLASIESQSSIAWKRVITAGVNLRFSSEGALESADLFGYYSINEELDLGLSYDVGVSKFRSQHAGSVELMVNYQFQKKSELGVKEVVPRYF